MRHSHIYTPEMRSTKRVDWTSGRETRWHTTKQQPTNLLHTFTLLSAFTSRCRQRNFPEELSSAINEPYDIGVPERAQTHGMRLRGHSQSYPRHTKHRQQPERGRSKGTMGDLVKQGRSDPQRIVQPTLHTHVVHDAHGKEAPPGTLPCACVRSLSTALKRGPDPLQTEFCVCPASVRTSASQQQAPK